tara:strand:- start:226 stop:507 length:282 start_codon:yes stop_codon:yes gene_type:complete
MNYKAELRGFALDRAIRIAELGKVHQMVSDIERMANEIVNYLYIPEKDIKSHLDTLLPLIVQSGDIDKIDTLILELQQIRAEMAANIIKPEVN